MNPTLILATIAIAILVVVSLFAWALGYSTAWAKSEAWEVRCREIVAQKAALATWVRDNWPDEYAAYRRGVAEGYQQGVSQAVELEALP
jgi:hypothetical protein